MNRTTLRKMHRRRELDRIQLILLAVFVVLAVIAGIIFFRIVRDVVASWSMTDLPGNPVIESGDKNAPPTLPTDFVQSNQPIQDANGPKPDPWDGKSRITVLVMGLDYRDWEDQNDAPRSDSMILLTLDPLSKTAGMLSIPRDMWVDIPGGYGYYKINTAYRFGELDDLPGGGPGLAMKTVEEFLGVPINYYAQIDFYAFERFIDELGGIRVDVKEPITLVPIDSHKVSLEPGVYTLPGHLALAYARNRHTEGDDFSRSERQQQVIMGVRDRILNFDMLPTLVAKSPILYKELASGIRTNMAPDMAIRLAWLAAQIKEENIKKGVIGPPTQVEFGTAPDGQSILIPVPDQIRLLRDEIFASTAPVGPASSNEDPAVLSQQEAARVSVQNGTGTAGLAERTADFLASNNINVVEKTNAAEMVDQTTIYLYNSKPYTAKYISSLLNLPAVRVYNRYDPNAQIDVVVVLGADWAMNNNLP